MLGNYFSLPLFFGIDFVFGSITTLLIIDLFGISWGLAVAIFANTPNWFLWGHPNELIIFTLEAAFIGLAWQRYSNHLLLLESIFWLGLGLPVMWVLYIDTLPPDTIPIALILLKFLVNGIFNASIACLIITFLPLRQWGRLPVTTYQLSLQRILLNLISIFVLLPTLLTMTFNGWLIVEKVETKITTDLNTLSTYIVNDLQSLYLQQIDSLQKFASLITQAHWQNSTELAQQARQLMSSFPEFLDITLLDTQGCLLFNYRQPANELNIYSPALHKPLFQSVLNTTQVLTFNTIRVEQGTEIPVIAHAFAVRGVDGKVTGVLLIYFQLITALHKIHAIHSLTNDTDITLTNEQGIVIDSTRTDLNRLSHYDHFRDFSSTEWKWLNSIVYPVFPQAVVHPILRWREAIYIQHTPVHNQLPLTLVVEMPMRPYLESWQNLYVSKLAIISIITFLSLILSVFISRWLISPLQKLAHITDNLSTRLELNQVIHWPQSRVSEINSLTNNFKSMAKSLQARFEEIHSTQTLLEQRVQKRTQELLHERALLCNLIDFVPDLIFYKDCEGKYLGCNKAFEEFKGINRSELLGQSDFDLFPPEKAQFCWETDKQTVTTGKPHAHEECGTYPDGHECLFDTLKAPFFALDGQVLGLIGISRDITARKQYEEALQQSEHMLRLVIDNIPQFIFWKDNYSVYLGCNQNYSRIVGLEQVEDIVGKTDADLMLYQQEGHAFFETLNRCIVADGQYAYRQVESVQLDNNTRLWLEINKVPLQDRQNQVMGVLGCFEDITERKMVEDKLRQSIKVFENSAEAICITDANTRIIGINKAFTKITGYTAREVMGKTPKILKSGKHKSDFYEVMWNAILRLGHWEGEIWNRRQNGEIFLEWLHISVIRDEQNQNQITNYLGIFSDLTSRKQTEQRLAYLVHYDDLTGLPNRTLFYELANRALYYAQQHSELVAIMFLDLDGFKYVNDTWGHLTGDLLLKKVASRLTECLRKTDTIARLGGDDFAIVLENINNVKEVDIFAQNILKAMSLSAFKLNGQETFITMSIGISLYPNDGQEVDTLLKNADMAMYRAKENGKNNHQFYIARLNVLSHQRLILETKLRHALEREELVLYYQPQLHLASGQIVGAEVLLRWQHPEMGLVLPYRFIPLAEETGLIVPIGEWVLQRTCLQYQRWREQGQALLRMSVNLSSRQFKQDNFIKRIGEIIEETCIDPTLLELELTESLLITDFDEVNHILHQLKEMGMLLAIDDFGTGYSSLSYLKRFPIDKLKIDQSFVRDVPNNKEDMSIIKAIIALARSLRLTVIAEGVETKSQQIFLKSLKCDEIQGYLIGRPMPEQEFIQMLNNRA
ncbi:sensor histidine kinase FexB [Thioploca ingrica]|uniref:cyclic-guanylate-specific phosphodiesterase n=1 Tax=Thioploca ingrica TaxID=40754 RepID=A0A090BW89_9GAMM|nr:sensor histidine kinase FexB [Thioploca ingrica]